MTTAVQDRSRSPLVRASRPRAVQVPAHRFLRADVTTAALAVIAGLGLGAVLAAAIQTSRSVELTAVWGLMLVGRIAAVVGTYGALWMVLLVARVPVIERAVGQDRLVAAHKTVGPWSIWLIAVHVVASVASWSLSGSVTWWSELWTMTRTVPWILAADVGALLLVVAGVTSWGRARRRLPRQVWWTVHLYTYLAIALSFAHQLTVGGPFLTGWARPVWVGLYVVVLMLILVHRVAVPLVLSLRHGLRVERVVTEAPGVVSVWVSGRHLERLHVRPGQFAQWRFLAEGLTYESHPYSFSAPVADNLMRVTVKDLGGSSALTSRLRPGTRVLMEGPYGVMTPERVRTTDHVVLVAGGVGVAPARALAEGVAQGGARVDLIIRASRSGDLMLQHELEVLATRPGTRLHTLVGHRDVHPMDAAEIRGLVPDIGDADLYVCGPAGLVDIVRQSADRLGVNQERLHVEDFEM